MSPRFARARVQFNLFSLVLGWTLFIFSTSLAFGQEKTFEDRALESGDDISTAIHDTAETIDLQLAGKKYTKKTNPSSIEISHVITSSEGGVLKQGPDFNVNLRLPNVEKRWQLRFSSFDEDQESRDVNQQYAHTRTRERDYGAGLFFFERLGSVKTSFLPRLKLKNPLEMSYTLRFEREVSLNHFRIVPRVDLYGDPTKGAGEFMSILLHWDLNELFNLEFQNAEEYHSQFNLFSTQHEVSLEHPLNDKQAIGLAVGLNSNNKPHYHLEGLTVSLPLSQQIYKKRLRASLTPFLAFAKSVHFKGDAGISLNTVLTF